MSGRSGIWLTMSNRLYLRPEADVTVDALEGDRSLLSRISTAELLADILRTRIIEGESGELNIEADFLEDQGHEGGQVWGRVRKDAKFGPHKYTVVNLTTGRRNDPTGMVDPDAAEAPSP